MREGIRPVDYIDARGLKRVWVAQRMGISQGHLSRLLSGERFWTPEMRNTFAMVAGLETGLFNFNVEAAETALERVGATNESNYTEGSDNGPTERETGGR